MSDVEVERENSIKGGSINILSGLKAVEAPTPFKKIKDLNDEEKKKIIDDIKAGKESEHYQLKEFKNGKTVIIKKKRPWIDLIIDKTKTKENLDTDKVFLTNDQLMNQRIIELEVKYAKLESKYKKQKKRVNDIFENIEEDVVIPPTQNIEVQEEKEVEKSPTVQVHQGAPAAMKVSSIRSLRFKR